MNFGIKQFIQFPSSLWAGMANKDQINGNCALVYMAILQSFPVMYPSIKTIAARTGLHRQTIFKYLNRLEELNILKRLRRFGTSNVYKLNPALLTGKAKTRGIDAFNKLQSAWMNRKIRTTRKLTNTCQSVSNQIKDLTKVKFNFCATNQATV